jgi:ubiquinone/menaquinone biosynthesis C-methylase UbiE
MTNPEILRLINEHGWSGAIESTGIDNAHINQRWLSSSTTFSDELSASLDNAASTSWWFETRNQIINKYFQSTKKHEFLWDIGSGPGVVSGYLQKQGIPSIAVEPSRQGMLGSAKRGLFSIESDLENLELPAASVHRIGLFDVLEHVEDRQKLLVEIRRVLTSSGELVITVPALNYLWSAADEHAGHFVRYSRKKLKQELNANGFTLKDSHYFFATLVLPLLLLRAIPYRLGIKQPVEDESLLKQNGGILGKLAQVIEVRLSRWLPIGSSLFAVAVKDDAL